MPSPTLIDAILSGAANVRAFLDIAALAHQYHPYVIFFQVKCDRPDAIFEFDQLTAAHIAQPIYTGNTVTDLQHGADFFQLGGTLVLLNC